MTNHSLYFTFKLILIGYLILPQFQGAEVIYSKFLRPFLIKEQSKIDQELDRVKVTISLNNYKE
jgi:receptor expression-enhancing protein 5/6